MQYCERRKDKTFQHEDTEIPEEKQKQRTAFVLFSVFPLYLRASVLRGSDLVVQRV